MSFHQSFVLAVAAIALNGCVKTEGTSSTDSTAASSTQTVGSSACATDNGGITLPDGFCATVFADTLGHARHIVVASNGDVYVNTWSGKYYQGATHPGGFLIALRDTNNDGKADIIKRFGPDTQHKNGGGTGIGIYKGALYAEEGDTITKRIVRYAISTDSMTPTAASETIVSGLPANGDHPMHPFVIDPTGNIYMDVGSATNSCQIKNRTLESPGHTRARSFGRARESGVTMRTRRTRSSHLPRGTRQASGTRSGSPLILADSFTRPSTGVTSSLTTGQNRTPQSRDRICPPKSC
jgi:glucose/arabinose dehydrogenase